MGSQNWVFGAVGAVMSMAIMVASVDPASAAGFEPASSTAASVDTSTVTQDTAPVETDSGRAADPLPVGDFSESFPVLEDDPSDGAPGLVSDPMSPSDSITGGVEVARDQFSVTRRIAGGVLVRDVSPIPVSTPGPDGVWLAIGTDFAVETPGVVSVENNPLNTVVKDTNSGTGVVVVSHNGVSLSSQLLGAQDSAVAVEPVEGLDAAVFANAVPHGDVEISAGLRWVKENVVLHAPGTASTWAWRLSANGLTLKVNDDNEVIAVDASGTETFRFEQPLAWDSADVASVIPLTVNLGQLTPTTWVMTVSAPREWLTDPARVFPVTIDPILTADYGDSTVYAYKSDGAVRTDGVHVGNSRDGSTNKYWRSVVGYNVSALAGKQVIAAQAFAGYAGYGTTSSQPGSVSTATCWGYSCVGAALAGFWVGTGVGSTSATDKDLASTISSWLPTASVTKKLMWRGDETAGEYTYKMLYTQVSVAYKDIPSITSSAPTSGAVTTTGPTFSVNSTDPANTGLQYAFTVYGSMVDKGSTKVDLSNVIDSTGWIEDDNYIPAPGKLVAGETYYYKAQVRDAYDVGWLTDHGQSSTTYFGASSADSTGYLRFTATNAVAQPDQLGVSVQPGDVITNYTPIITAPMPSPSTGITDYEVTVSSNPDGLSGTVASSGKLPVAGLTDPTMLAWQVPAGTLRDGGQYYVTIRTGGANGMSYPAWVTSFTLNRRLGSAGPSPMETFGAMSVNLASGNVTASVPTPTISTAGGPIGFLFNYNSQDESNRGLMGSYYQFDATEDIPSWSFTGKEPVIVRQDPAVNFNLVSGKSPAPGLDADRYAVKWSGYVTLAPGTYNFGMKHNNGARIVVDGVTLLDSWKDAAYSTTVHFDGSKTVTTTSTRTTIPITIDFYQTTSSMQAVLFVKKSSDASSAFVPVSANMLSLEIPILPDGWSTSTVLAGSVSQYSSVDVLENSIVVHDLAGGVHTYKKLTGGGFEPPKGEYGVVSLTGSNTVTLTDDDGTVYQFTNAGKLATVTPPGDSRKPAQPKISFDSNGRVTSISDPLSVDTSLQNGKNTSPSRVVQLTYKSATTDNCANGTIASNAPSGMLCKITYPIVGGSSTSTSTFIRYSSGRVYQITNPGGEEYSFTYSTPTGARIPLMREFITPYASDLESFSNDLKTETSTPSVSYDTANDVAKPANVKLPRPTGTVYQYVDFVWGDHTTTTQIRSNPLMKHTVTYDESWRGTSSTSAMGYESTQTWGAFDALVRVSNASTGLTTTRVFDTDGRVTDVYGPAPAECFPANSSTPVEVGCPVTVAHTHTSYDTGIAGLAATYFGNKLLTGAPTGFDTLVDQTVVVNGADSTGVVADPAPVSGTDGGNGLRLTGLVTFDAAGEWWVKATTNQSVTMTIADAQQARVTAVSPMAIQDAISGTITVLDNATLAAHKNTQRIRLDLGHLKSTGATLTLWWKHGETGVWERIPSTAFSPDYGLKTTTQTQDSASGEFANKVAGSVTEYSYTTPWLGQVTSTNSGDGTTMSTSTASFESPDAVDSLNRLESTTMPSGAAENYDYYPLNQTLGAAYAGLSVPCGLPSGTVIGGFLKSRTDTAGIMTEFVYDNWGRTVGSKKSGDTGWTCTIFDSRSRVTQVSTPAFDTGSAATITTTYAVGGDPRNTSVSDGTHVEVSSTDTLGRIVSTTDSVGTVTTTIYDTETGRVTSATSTPAAGAAVTVSYTYDLDGKVLTVSRNGSLTATLNYDGSTGRLTAVTYPDGTAVGFGYGLTGTVDTKTYTTPAGTYAETVTRSQSGRILRDTFITPDGSTDPTTYTYDAFGRLTKAVMSDRTIDYGFDAITSCEGTGNEPSAGLNGNRTSTTHTINGVSTVDTYCYDGGDRLTSATQVDGSIVYDAHGNITQLGDVFFTYDSLDRHIGTTLPDGTVISLVRDVDGSVLTRTVSGTGAPAESVTYSSGVVDFYLNSALQVTGTTQSLPGGVTKTDSNNAVSTSFTSLQGNACVTVTASGTTRTRFDPFGTPLTALPDVLPGSAEAGFGAVAGKLTDTLSQFGLIEMGARLYSTVLGRFLQVDPVPGGGINAYVYPPDPVNANDYSGKVMTADSFDSWGATSVWDWPAIKAGLDERLKTERDARAKEDANFWGAISLGLTVAAWVVVAVGCAICASVALGVSIASTAAGAISTANSCSIKVASFDCISGVATLGLGGVGKISERLIETNRVGKELSGTWQVAQAGVGIGKMSDIYGNTVSTVQTYTWITSW